MNILFLCASNVTRSQMAEAFFNKYSKNHKAKSAALVKSQEKMHALVIRAMKERGIDISKNISKKITEEMLVAADMIVLMNKNLKMHIEELKKHIKPNAKIEIWDIPDIVAKETDEYLYPEFCRIRDITEEKIKKLLNKIESNIF